MHTRLQDVHGKRLWHGGECIYIRVHDMMYSSTQSCPASCSTQKLLTAMNTLVVVTKVCMTFLSLFLQMHQHMLLLAYELPIWVSECTQTKVRPDLCCARSWQAASLKAARQTAAKRRCQSRTPRTQCGDPAAVTS